MAEIEDRVPAEVVEGAVPEDFPPGVHIRNGAHFASSRYLPVQRFASPALKIRSSIGKIHVVLNFVHNI